MNEISVKEQFKWWARIGYAARGTIYVTIGLLAIAAAFAGGSEGKATDSKGAITTLAQQPFGNVLLVILVIGLAGYSSWRLVQAIKDTDDHGTEAKGLAIRGGLLVSAISHTVLAIWTITLIWGGDSGGQSQSASQGLLSTGIGQIAIGLAGLCGIGAGIAHIIKGYTARFDRYLDIPEHTHRFTRPLCRFGLIARGVVWCMVGWFLVRSAWVAGGSEISGVGDALEALLHHAFGPWLMGVVAAGLFAFGVYSFLEAIYRRINVPSSS